jgi:hypothetical protein
LSPHHISLYMMLFEIWNQIGFKETFTIRREELMSSAKIGSKDKYYRCLEDLAQYGYIKLEKSTGMGRPCKVTMHKLYTESGTLTVPDKVHERTDSGTSVLPKEGQINKTNTTTINMKKRLNMSPKQDAVKRFFAERNFSATEANKFWYNYEMLGWPDSNHPGNDWQALALKWVERSCSPLNDLTDEYQVAF